MDSVIKNSLKIKLSGKIYDCQLVYTDYSKILSVNNYRHLDVIMHLPSSIILTLPTIPNPAYVFFKNDVKLEFIDEEYKPKWKSVPGNSYNLNATKLISLHEKREYIECNDGKIVIIKDKGTTDYETFLNWLNYTDLNMELSEYVKSKEINKRAPPTIEEPKDPKKSKNDKKDK